jgi:hypothetical protein
MWWVKRKEEYEQAEGEHVVGYRVRRRVTKDDESEPCNLFNASSSLLELRWYSARILVASGTQLISCSVCAAIRALAADTAIVLSNTPAPVSGG